MSPGSSGSCKMSGHPCEAAAAGRDVRLVEIERALSAIDLVRRLVAGGNVPVAGIYLEGARGNLHHAREAILRELRPIGSSWSVALPGGRLLQGVAGQRLCGTEAATDWTDEVLPAEPDLGAALFASDEVRDAAAGRCFGAMLATALADHAWLHLGTGTSWSTDRSGALALVGALSSGRPVDVLSVEDLSGALDHGMVRRIAALGWRRLRSPTWNG